MTDSVTSKPSLSDEEIAAMISGGKPGRKKADPDQPGPRLPEALYYYLFILLEAAMLMGVWGFMRRGAAEVMKGPPLEAPVLDQVVFHLNAMFTGVNGLFAAMPWVPAGVMLLSGAVFVPTTPRKRRRISTLLSTVLVCVFVLLIALQFSEDMSRLSVS